MPSPQTPTISVVLIVYKMREQALNTLLSLSSAYQRNVEQGAVEIIVVENASDELLGADKAQTYDPSVRYFLREEDSSSPVNSLNFGVSQAQAQHVAVMIDGARMLSPGLLSHCLQVAAMNPHGIVTVPGYHLGEKLQQESALEGYDAAFERTLLDSIAWQDEGYRLFDIACLSGSCKAGYFLPMAESNFLMLPKELYTELGGYDVRFNTHGGGYANLDLYKRVCESVDGEIIILFGEGTFHQFHGGATTGGVSQEERKHVMPALAQQYEDIRGSAYKSPQVSPQYFGKISTLALKYLGHSLDAYQNAIDKGAA